jgi:biotin transport system substrate-specific component
MVENAGRYAQVSRTKSIAFCGLCIALMAVCSWITVPFGPVPFTLQTFAAVFAFLLLKPKEALASIALYLLMGAIGLPMFSSMRGGFGVILGPTGGFLWGFLLGAVVALGFIKLATLKLPEHHIAVDAIAGVLFLLVCYVCGWFQLAAVAHMGLAAAFAVGVAPFIIIDAVKLAVAIALARAVRKAVY